MITSAGAFHLIILDSMAVVCDLVANPAEMSSNAEERASEQQ
jgi:hypothetical protein